MGIRFVIFFYCCLLLNSFALRAFEGEDSLQKAFRSTTVDTVKVEILITLSQEAMNSDFKKMELYAEQAVNLAKRVGYKEGIAQANRYLGLAYYFQGAYGEAVDSWQQGVNMFDSIGDKANVARLYSNIGAVYYNQSDDVKALEFYIRSQRIAEEIQDTARLMAALNNIGAIYGKKSVTYDKAIEYDLRALKLGEVLEDNLTIGTLCANIGEIYMNMDQDTLALKYFIKSLNAHKDTENEPVALRFIGQIYMRSGDYKLAIQYQEEALAKSRSLDSKLDIEQSLTDLATTYAEMGENRKAIRYYLEAMEIANEISSKEDLKDIYAGLSDTYRKSNDYRNAYKYQELLTAVKDTIYNIEFDQKMSGQIFNYEIEKKQNQITILNKDKELQDLDLKRQKFAKNAFQVGLGLILVIAFILLRMYFMKVKTNKILDKQKDQIETLLLNTLPKDVVRELEEKGTTTPKHYDQVSVLFTDFKSFTKLASALTPTDLVKELTTFFTAYDDIISKYGLEKIKTIGDAYMCAGGIPTPDPEHPYNMIRAGLEIQEYMTKVNKEREESGKPVWGLRMGIHTGPVVAGVVGKKKYAYDIWGNAVNTASRMESNSEPGRVNISRATYDLVKDRFACTYRGKISAKNIGDIDMYFVDHEIKEPEPLA
jgi:class 3 adenylate cyclase/DNA-dependent RNA polymerase auxiliary subunit epsilon